MGYPTNALAKYGAVNVTTSSPGQFVVMLYDGLFRFLREASSAIEAQDRVRLGDRVQRALAVLRHLLGSMEPEQNPLLFERLTSLYLFSMRRITEGNLQRDPAMFDEVFRVLWPLRQAFHQAAEEAVRKGAAERAAAMVAVARTG